MTPWNLNLYLRGALKVFMAWQLKSFRRLGTKKWCPPKKYYLQLLWFLVFLASHPKWVWDREWGHQIKPPNRTFPICAALLLLLRWLLSNSSSSSWVKKQVEKKDGLRSSKARNVMRGYREMGCNHQIGDSECEHHHTYLEFLLAVSYNWLQYQTPFFPPRLHLSSQWSKSLFSC